ncbi:MAG: dihydrodipicolinate synthase family protein [Cyclobacteriaceae bacterium]|nr:dihydrodipicolinate synthase family protein [Cyclobacteriaceae bacterium]
MNQKVNFFEGVMVPMITPATQDGNIDEVHAAKMIRFLLDNNTIPFILGTTGEVASISIPQREKLVRILLENKRKEVPLVVGMGSLTVKETFELSNKFFAWGIDAVVLTIPNYFKLGDEQIFRYFENLAEKIDGKIILYNIPATTHNSIPIDVADRLSYLENIVGIKDSENNKSRLLKSLELWQNREDFIHLVGVNDLMATGLTMGSSGIVPSSANLVPHLYYQLFTETRAGNEQKVSEIQELTRAVTNVYKDDFLLGESLAALKYLLSEQGHCLPYMFAPLCELDEVQKKCVKARWLELTDTVEKL